MAALALFSKWAAAAAEARVLPQRMHSYINLVSLCRLSTMGPKTPRRASWGLGLACCSNPPSFPSAWVAACLSTASRQQTRPFQVGPARLDQASSVPSHAAQLPVPSELFLAFSLSAALLEVLKVASASQERYQATDTGWGTGWGMGCQWVLAALRLA